MSPLPSLSVILITKNEAHNIAACLESVSFAQEMIVVDSGSLDRTALIAKQMGAHVTITTDWPGFGIQKNRALDLATGDWILSIDADERVTASLAFEIQQAIKLNKSDIFAFPRRTSFCGQWINHCGWTPDHVARLFKRGSARFNERLVHESVQALLPGTKVLKTLHALDHYSYPTPNHYWDKLKIYSEAWSIQNHQLGKSTSIARAMTSSIVAFVRSYVLRFGFLDGALGFVVCQMQAQATFYKYFQLYFLNQMKKNTKS